MNTVPRLPVPQHDHYVLLIYPALLGGGDERRGPFRTYAEAQRALRSARAPYPAGLLGGRIESVVRDAR